MIINKTFSIETRDASFEMSTEENLLDALLVHGYEVEYQCRNGYCGSCRTKINSGEVEYDELPLAHINTDEILPCCCRVKETLSIEVKLRQVDDGQGDLFKKL